MRQTTRLAGAATLALGLLAGLPAAEAAVIQVNAPQQLSAAPITFSLGTATFSLTLDTSTGLPGSAIATGGSGMVTSFFGGPTDFGAGAVINNDPANLVFSFSAFPSPSIIPDSVADDFVGFSFSGTGGTHYGFAEVFGATFVGYAYESAPNTAITTAAVPEPASAALLITGLATLGMARRKKRNLRELAA